jgi:hypothetical protein
MFHDQVGALAVVDGSGRPMGFVTGRDIVGFVAGLTPGGSLPRRGQPEES